MSIEQIKKEAWYYCGKHISDKEAEEILSFAEDYLGGTLDEIISDYYSC